MEERKFKTNPNLSLPSKSTVTSINNVKLLLSIHKIKKELSFTTYKLIFMPLKSEHWWMSCVVFFSNYCYGVSWKQNKNKLWKSWGKTIRKDFEMDLHILPKQKFRVIRLICFFFQTIWVHLAKSYSVRERSPMQGGPSNHEELVLVSW